jgi:hypothetical protein
MPMPRVTAEMFSSVRVRIPSEKHRRDKQPNHAKGEESHA